jgi:hypothetical protein
LTEPLQVGQFAIVDHEPVDRGPNAGVFHGKGPADDRAELFVVAEGTTPAGEAFAGHVVSAIGHTFNGLDMSLTGSLRRLFTDAERALADWNRKSIAQHRVSLGLTCFGRRGDQAVIAQAGPSAAFHFHNGQVTAYFSEGESARPIGSGPVEPRLTRINFAAGDRLLAISTAALTEIDDDLVAGILGLPEEQVLPDLYRRISHLRHLTVVLVTNPGARLGSAALEADETFVIDGTAMGEASREPQDDGPSFQPHLFFNEEADESLLTARRQLLEIHPRRPIDTPVPEVAAEIPAPLLRASGETTAALSRMAAENRARAERSRAAASALAVPQRMENSMAATAGTLAAPPAAYARAAYGGPMNTQRRRPTRQESFTRGLVPPELPPSRPPSSHEDLPLVDELAATRRARATMGGPISETIATESHTAMNGGSLVRVRTNMGGRWKGNGSINRSRTTGGTQLPPTWLVIMSGLAILLVLVGIVTVPKMLENDDSARYVELIDGASAALATSRVMEDPAKKREALVSAHAMLLEARDIGPANGQAETLINEVAGSLRVMDNVHTPAAVEGLASLQQYGENPIAVVRMAIGPQAAYVIDANAARVVAIPFGDGASPVVAFQEDRAAEQGKPIAVASLEASDLGGPVALIADTGNRLWAYSADGGLRRVEFAAPSNLVFTDIAVHGRDLYVLDAGQKAVYRFIQTAAGFPNAPEVVLQSDDLINARRLRVDGEIITADANGVVHRFISGQVALTLGQAGIDKTLVAAETAQFISENELAFLDAPNNRIVVFRRDGTFERQYQHPDFKAASAFVIRDGQAYIFSDLQLRLITW